MAAADEQSRGPGKCRPRLRPHGVGSGRSAMHTLAGSGTHPPYGHIPGCANGLVGLNNLENARGRAITRPPSRRRPLRYPMVNSWVCGFRWPSFMAPATVLSLRFQVVNPRVMSDS